MLLSATATFYVRWRLRQLLKDSDDEEELTLCEDDLLDCMRLEGNHSANRNAISKVDALVIIRLNEEVCV